MKQTIKNILLCTLFIIGGSTSTAQTDTTLVQATDSAQIQTENAADTIQTKKGLVRKVVDYFLNADRHAGKKFDFGFLPGPHFSSTVGLGLGMVATGLYSLDRSDPTLQKSNVTIYADATTKGFFMTGIKGNNIFKKERYRLDYQLYIYTFKTDFWGMGFDNGKVDDNETDYKRIRFNAMARFMFKLAPKTYLGPIVSYGFYQARDIDPRGVHLFEGQDKTVRSTKAGLSFTYDTRDFILNAYKGVFVQLDQTFAPRFLGNDYCFSSTELTASAYKQVWRGGILAGDFHMQYIDGHPAWCTMSEAGSTTRLRGYFDGRYRDKSIMEAQVELRQHVWRRNGIAVWVGAGQVFPNFSAMRWNRTLPNAGIGYRWEFKKRVNIRLDYGFTRDGGGVIFNINEAF